MQQNEIEGKRSHLMLSFNFIGQNFVKEADGIRIRNECWKNSKAICFFPVEVWFLQEYE